MYKRAIGLSVTATLLLAGCGQMGVQPDKTPPGLTLSAPTLPGNNQPLMLSSKTLTIKGKATDNSALASVTVVVNGGAPQNVTIAVNGDFEVTLDNLQEGENTIKVTVKDKAGNSKDFTFKVMVDTTAPQINLDAPTEGAVTDKQVTVTGEIKDADGIKSATLALNGGDPVNLTLDNAGKFSLNVNNLVAGENTLTIVTEDKLGNKSNKSIKITSDQTAPVLTLQPVFSVMNGKATVTGMVAGDRAGEVLTVEVKQPDGTFKPATVTQGKFSATIDLTSNKASLQLRAADVFGNSSTLDQNIDATTLISGVLTSESAGAAVSGSQILVQEGNAVVGEGTTSNTGTFAFGSTREGTFDLQFNKTGYAGSKIFGVPMKMGESVYLRAVSKQAFDPANTTDVPELSIETYTGSEESPVFTKLNPGMAFTGVVPFRVRATDNTNFTKPLRNIYVALGRTPGTGLITQGSTYSRFTWDAVSNGADTETQLLSGALVNGMSGKVFLEVVSYDYNYNRAHYLIPIVFTPAATNAEAPAAPTKARATAITLNKANGMYSTGQINALKQLTLFNKTRNRVDVLNTGVDAAPAGTNLWVNLTWSYTGTTPDAFDIYRTSQKNAEGKPDNFRKLTSVGGGTGTGLKYVDIDPALEAGTEYFYKVVARTAGGAADSNITYTTPLGHFQPLLLSPADNAMNVSKTPTFTMKHPQLSAGADGALYSLLVSDIFTGDSRAFWNPVFRVEAGTGEGNGVDVGNFIAYTSKLLTPDQVNLVGDTLSVKFNFDGSAQYPELLSLRTYQWGDYISYAYKYSREDEGYRVNATSVYADNTSAASNSGGFGQEENQIFKFTVGQ